MSFTTQPMRFRNIQALRGLAVLAVVLAHLMSVERKYAGDQLLGNVFSIGLSGVDLFFAISGFVMVYVAWRIPGGVRPALSFLFARISRIYPLYWFVTLMVVIVWLWHPDMVFASIGQVSLLHSFTLWPAHYPPLLAVGWTLIHEMYFYLVFTLLVLMVPRFRPWALAAWGPLVMVGFLAGAGTVGPVLQIVFHPLSFEFLGGSLAALMFGRCNGKGWGLALLAGGLFFVAACFLSLRLGPGFWESWPRAASFTPAVSLLVYGAAGAERSGRVFNRMLVWLGNQSYALYLTHVLSISAAGRIWRYFATEGYVDNVLMLPLLMAVAVIFAQGVHRFIETPLLDYSKRLRRKFF